MIRILLSLFFILLQVSHAFADDILKTSEQSLEHLEDTVSVHTLSNGLKIVFYPRGVAPVFSVVTTVGVGGVDEIKGETGIAHMFEHMAFKGTSQIGTNDFLKEKTLLNELEDIAAIDPHFFNIPADKKNRLMQIQKELQMLWKQNEFTLEYEKRGGGDLNAQTDKDHTTYMVSLPRNAFEFWASTESARLKDPVMRQFYQERSIVLEERRMRFDNEPASLLYENLLQKAFTTHPYRLPLIGYKEDIESLTARKLEAFRKKYYVPNNIVISLVGAVDPANDIKLIEKYFSDIPRGKDAPELTSIEPEQKEEKVITQNADASPQIFLAYHKPSYPHKDDAALSVLDEMLCGSSKSPMYDRLVKKERIATQIANEEGPGTRYPNLVIFSLIPRLPTTNQFLLKRFDETLNEFLSNDINESLMQQAKRSIAISYLGQMKSNLTLATSLSSVELQYHDWKAMLTWYKEAMAITSDDIRRVGRKYLTPTNRTVGFLETSSPGVKK